MKAAASPFRATPRTPALPVCLACLPLVRRSVAALPGLLAAGRPGSLDAPVAEQGTTDPFRPSSRLVSVGSANGLLR